MSKKGIFLFILLFCIGGLFIWFFTSKSGMFVTYLFINKMEEQRNVAQEKAIQQNVCSDVSFEISEISCAKGVNEDNVIKGKVKNIGQSLKYLFVTASYRNGTSLMGFEEKIQEEEVRILGPYDYAKKMEYIIFTPVIDIDGKEQECPGYTIPAECQ